MDAAAAAAEPAQLAPTRLERAFSALNGDTDILALHDFTCCQRCGGSEANQEALEANKRAYVFYHAQSLDGALYNGQLYLHYNTAFDSEAAMEQIMAQAQAEGKVPDFRPLRGMYPDCLGYAQQMVAALEKEGLEVEWPGNTDTAIIVMIPEEDRHFLQSMRQFDSEDEDWSDEEDIVMAAAVGGNGTAPAA